MSYNFKHNFSDMMQCVKNPKQYAVFCISRLLIVWKSWSCCPMYGVQAKTPGSGFCDQLTPTIFDICKIITIKINFCMTVSHTIPITASLWQRYAVYIFKQQIDMQQSKEGIVINITFVWNIFVVIFQTWNLDEGRWRNHISRTWLSVVSVSPGY